MKIKLQLKRTTDSAPSSRMSGEAIPVISITGPLIELANEDERIPQG